MAIVDDDDDDDDDDEEYAREGTYTYTDTHSCSLINNAFIYL